MKRGRRRLRRRNVSRQYECYNSNDTANNHYHNETPEEQNLSVIMDTARDEDMQQPPLSSHSIRAHKTSQSRHLCDDEDVQYEVFSRPNAAQVDGSRNDHFHEDVDNGGSSTEGNMPMDTELDSDDDDDDEAEAERFDENDEELDDEDWETLEEHSETEVR